MTNTKKMHYIPQFLLNNFSCDSNKHIFVWDKTTNLVRKQEIQDVAEENMFYDLQIDKFYYDETLDIKQTIDESCEKEFGKKYSGLSALEKLRANKWFEDFFSEEVEGPLSSFFQKLNQNYGCRNLFYPKPPRIIDPKTKVSFSKMLGVLFVRTKWYRDNLQHCLAEGTKQAFIMESYMMGKPVNENFDVFYSKDGIRYHHLQSIINEIDNSTIGYVFFKKTWLLIYNETGVPFCCSDDYFTMIQTIEKKDSFSGVGLDSPGVELWLPISDKVMLSFHDPEQISHRYDGCVLRLKDKQLVLDNNFEIAHQSYKYCFCNDEGELSRLQAKGQEDPRILKPKSFITINGK